MNLRNISWIAAIVTVVIVLIGLPEHNKYPECRGDRLWLVE